MCPAPSPRILIADDQPDIIEALRLLLKGEGFQTEAVRSPAAALKALEARDYALLLMDLNYARDTTSGQEGLDLLAKVQSLDATLPVVVMTAWASVDLAVEAMRRGARDFVTKPWDNPRLIAIVRNQIELGSAVRSYRRLEQENQLLRGKPARPLIAESAAMRPVLEVIARVGPSDVNVLITGENGTGKGLAAQALHAISGRAGKPFISVNMGGLAARGLRERAFRPRPGRIHRRQERPRRALRAGGGRDPFPGRDRQHPGRPAGQDPARPWRRGEFERVGSSRTFRANVRLISATNADLPAEVAAGRFRQDLLFRLNTVHLHLPPLRERREDIELLAQHFLKRHAERYRKGFTGFDESALQALRAHAWPGNVRELDHAIERAVLMAQGKVIRAADLGLNAAQAAPRFDDLSLEEVEALLIKKTLARCDGNARQAAEELGLSRSAFYRRLEKHRL